MLSGLVTFLNWIIKNLGDMLSWVIVLLPKSPVSDWIESLSFEQNFLNLLNYFFPLQEFIPLALAILTAYGTARGIWALLRIGRMVD